ncbi:MAG TPA: tetratricopeptide repeat protein [Terriglobia bacterium]|nr:tetratricopeptide repeat protein [Terriglobia bacterium]
MSSKKKARQYESTWSRFGQGLLPAAVLVLLTCVIYWNSTDAPFVFDDLETIQRNRIVRFGEYFGGSYLNPALYLWTRSLLFVTFIFNNWLNGQNAFGYHVVNLVLHIFNGLLVFAIGTKVLGSVIPDRRTARMYALLAAAFFLVHPVQTESVTYISSRSELLSTLPYLFALWFFMLLPEAKIGFFASLAILIFLLLGFGSKETVVTLPATILLYDYLFIAKCQLRRLLDRWRFYLSFVILTAGASYYLLSRQVEILSESGENLPRGVYLLTQFRVMVRYIRLLIVPTGLNLDYNFPLSGSLLDPAAIASFLFLIALVVAGWKWRHTRPVFAFSIFWFFITLAPTSSIIPIPDVIFEHRMYLPLAGVCLSFPLAVEWAVKAWRGGIRTRPALGPAIMVLAILSVATVLRNEVWRDEVRLWSDVVDKSPHKLRPYNQLIYAQMKRGQDAQAISVAKRGLQNVPEGRLNFSGTLGNLYLRVGRPDEAVTYFKTNTEEAGRLGFGGSFLAGSYNNLGVAYAALAKNEKVPAARMEAFRKARESYEKSLEASPTNVGVLDSLVNVRRSLGETSMLEQELRKKLEANPREFPSLYSMAALLSLEERYQDSIGYFQLAENLEPYSEVLYFNYALALSKTGQVDPAIAKYLLAIQTDPLFNEAHYNLALLYLQKLDYEAAAQHLTDILGREPANVRANMKLGEIYAYQGKLPSARQHLQLVLQAEPQNSEALALSQRIGTH